jgi:hypothetical protein
MIKINAYTAAWDNAMPKTMRAGTHVKIWQGESGQVSADGREYDELVRVLREAGMELTYVKCARKTSTYKVAISSCGEVF